MYGCELLILTDKHIALLKTSKSMLGEGYCGFTLKLLKFVLSMDSDGYALSIS